MKTIIKWWGISFIILASLLACNEDTKSDDRKAIEEDTVQATDFKQQETTVDTQGEIATEEQEAQAPVTITSESEAYLDGNDVAAKLTYENEEWIYTTIGEAVTVTNKRDDQQSYEIRFDNLEEYENVAALTVKGDWIYYLLSGSIWKMQLDGSNKQEIYPSGRVVTFIVDENAIYLINNDQFPGNAKKDILYRVDLDGNNEQQLFESPTEQLMTTLVISDGYLYIQTDNVEETKIKRIDLANPLEAEDFFPLSGITNDLQMYQDKLYFMEGNMFKSIDEVDRKEILEEPDMSGFKIFDDQLFYVTTTDTQEEIIRYDFETQEKTVIVHSTNFISDFSVTSKEVKYLELGDDLLYIESY
ncbi:DUF5050 domain-containing protein [Oceanobacillus halotolerans]|uniref:DUF5050 domain-containing protein n=1 Tax=Oceanobacillus halotolerans TaxID=2663380 RepID=UPI0013DCF480|nr:DUF5050 domain-containing protein [Oceanobacillus halotolerans]